VSDGGLMLSVAEKEAARAATNFGGGSFWGQDDSL